MPRPKRVDYPGAWVHVMIRALSQRALFEGRADIRYFLACIARAVRRGEIEVHVYSVLTTHAHLLVRSPKGQVSRALRRIMSDYVRRYNRRRERSGPLVRSRFNSKHVDSDAYWMAVVRYIDQNPVAAGLAPTAVAYSFGSRRHYSRRRGPPWLSRERVEAEVCTGKGPYDPDHYDRVFTRPSTTSLGDALERAVVRGDRPSDPNLDVIGAASPAVREWLLRNAVLADGRRMGPTLVPAAIVLQVVSEQKRLDPNWLFHRERDSLDRWQVLLAGLLRAFAGESQKALALRMGLPRSTFRGLCDLHRNLTSADADYRQRLQSVGEAVLLRAREEYAPERSP